MERELAARLRDGLESGAVDMADIMDAADALERLVRMPERPEETSAMRLARKLREASHHALMDAARDTVSEAADEIDRLLLCIDCYARSSAAAAAEITQGTLLLNSQRALNEELVSKISMLESEIQRLRRNLAVALAGELSGRASE